MIIFIASEERQQLLDESIADDREIYRYIAPADGISMLGFVKSKMPRHRVAYSDLVIDRAAISENTDEFIKALKLLKQMYDIRITVIADDLKEDDILAIIDLQIFNIITESDGEDLRFELKQALSEEGISQLKWLRLIRSREAEKENAEKASVISGMTSARRTACVIGAAAVCAILIAAAFMLKGKDEEKSAAVTTAATTCDTVSQGAAVTTTAAPIPTTTTTVTTTEPEPITTSEPTVTPEITTTTEVTAPHETTTTTVATTTTTAKKTTATEKKTTTTAKQTTTAPKKTTTTTTTTTAKPYVALHGLKLSCPQAAGGVISLRAGESAQITPVFTPDNATNRRVSWKSTDDDIAVISADGKVTAVSAGSCVIKCSTVTGERFEVGIMVTVR